MFYADKRLQFPVRVEKPNPVFPAYHVNIDWTLVKPADVPIASFVSDHLKRHAHVMCGHFSSASVSASAPSIQEISAEADSHTAANLKSTKVSTEGFLGFFPSSVKALLRVLPEGNTYCSAAAILSRSGPWSWLIKTCT